MLEACIIKKYIFMKIKAKLICILALVLTISACTNKEKKVEPLKVLRVGVRGVTNAMVLYAKYEKLFNKNGIKVKVEYVISDNGNTVIELFLSNRIDVAELGDQPAVTGWLKGVDVKAVANLPTSPQDTWLMVADSQKIRTIRDLKGKKIGVNIGRVNQHWLFLALRQAGMKVTDVKSVNIPNGDAIAALAANEIDASVFSEPTISLLQEKKIASKLKGSQCVKAYSSIVLVSGDIYRNHPEVIKPIVATYHDANAWVADNPDKVVDLIKSQLTYKELPKNILKRQYGTNRSKIKYIGITDSVIVSYGQIVDFLKELKAIPQHGTIADSIQKFYDSRFVDEYYKDRAKRENTTVATIIKKETTKILK